MLLHLVACLGKCHGMEMASPEGPPGCSLQCSPMVRCKDNCGTSSEGSGGEGPHWWCAFQVTFTVSVSHGVGSLYTLTSGTVQSFVRNKGFHSLSCLLHTCKWLDIDLTSDCLVSPFPNCVKDFIRHQDLPWAQDSPSSFKQRVPLPFSVGTGCSLQQSLQTQPLLRSEKQLCSGWSPWM